MLQDMADFMARRTGLTKKKADVFVRAFFETIQEGLRNDQFVKIKGFGTFKIVEVGERESVNINTGERFRISGHTKISFTPENSLRDSVNRPFAHFQTIILNDDTDIEELESITTPEEETTPPQPASVQPMDTGGVPEPDTSPLSEHSHKEKSPKDDSVADVETSGSLHETPLSETDTDGEDMADSNTDSETEMSEGSKEDDFTEEADHNGEEEEEINADAKEAAVTPAAATEVFPSAPEEAFGTEDAVDAEGQSKEPKVESEMGTEMGTEEPDPQQETEEEDDDEAEATEEGEEMQPAAGPLSTASVQYILPEESVRCYKRWKLIAITLFVILMMLMSYFAGYFKVFCPCEASGIPSAIAHRSRPTLPAPAKTQAKAAPQEVPGNSVPQTREEVAPQVPEPEKPQATSREPAKAKPQSQPAPKPQNNEQAAAPHNDIAQVKGGKYVITGTRSLYRIDRGETIRSIAENVYGSKGYAPYIIVHNHLRNPDQVAVGTIIHLPELEPKEP